VLPSDEDWCVDTINSCLPDIAGLPSKTCCAGENRAMNEVIERSSIRWVMLKNGLSRQAKKIAFKSNFDGCDEKKSLSPNVCSGLCR
jgi:hypothetical protein